MNPRKAEAMGRRGPRRGMVGMGRRLALDVRDRGWKEMKYRGVQTRQMTQDGDGGQLHVHNFMQERRRRKKQTRTHIVAGVTAG